MKILIINCVFPPEPVVSAKIGNDISTFLAKKHEVTVIAPFSSRPLGFIFTKAVDKYNLFKVIRLKSYVHPKSGLIGRMRESLSFGWYCYRFIIKNKHYDKIYMNTWPLFAQLGVALACKKHNIPYVIHIQDIYPESLLNKLPNLFRKVVNEILTPIDRFSLNNASAIIAISNKMQHYIALSRELPLSKIEVVTNWQSEEEFFPFQSTWPNETKEFTFMYLGNIGPVAGVDFLIRSFVKANIRAKLIIAGSGTEKQNCIKLAKALNSSTINFIDVPEGKVPEIQSKAHVLLLPVSKSTKNTSIPSKLPAYMFSARPIIVLADKNSDIAEIIELTDCGWIGDSEDESRLIDIFHQVNNSLESDLRQKGRNGLEFAKTFFSKEKNLSKLADILLR